MNKISKAVSQKIQLALRLNNVEEARKIVARAWKRHLPFGGNQLTWSRTHIEMVFGCYVTQLLLDAEIFDFFGGANDQIVRRF